MASPDEREQADAEPESVCARCGWPADVVPGPLVSVEEHDWPKRKRMWFVRCTNPGCENRLGRAIEI